MKHIVFLAKSPRGSIENLNLDRKLNNYSTKIDTGGLSPVVLPLTLFPILSIQIWDPFNIPTCI